MLNSYKIVDGKALTASGHIVPVGYTKYTVGEEPRELIDGLAFKTPEEIASAKWVEIGTFWNKLTVTINGNKYKADEAGTNRMALKRDALAADATTKWYEDWGSFSTNKVELQDAITAADVKLQAFIDATMGAA